MKARQCGDVGEQWRRGVSGDDKSMDEILREVREIVAKDGGVDGKNASEKARPGQPVRMIGFETGIVAATPFVLLALLWGHWLSRRLLDAPEFQASPAMIVLLVSLATRVGDRFRQPVGRADWIILPATLFLAAMALTTSIAAVNWLAVVAAPDLNGLVSAATEVLFGLGALVATLWIASRLTRDRNLILPREHGADKREGGAA